MSLNDQKLIDLRNKCPECGAGLLRITDQQRQALQVAIEALRQAGFEVKLIRMYQAEPVMMAMMISKAAPPGPPHSQANGEGNE